MIESNMALMENANLWINVGIGLGSAVHEINGLKRLMDQFHTEMGEIYCQRL